MKDKWECQVCGYIYDSEVGVPGKNILPGTPWDRLPENWVCPECGISKDFFEKLIANPEKNHKEENADK